MARDAIINKKRIQYEGKIYPTNNYGDAEVIRYDDSRHVHIKFLNTGNVEVVRMSTLLDGEVRDHVLKRESITVRGIGKYGIGKYEKTTHNHIYIAWEAMMRRCYYQKTPNSYADCSVCDEWHDFQKFAAWYEPRYSDICIQVDKDILVRGNRIYSPDTCCVVPCEINNAMILHRELRGEFPIGVFLAKIRKSDGKKIYGAQYYAGGKRRHAGTYETPEEAFNAYKKAKEGHVKMLAEKYKSDIEPRVYDALMNFSVNINN